MSTSQNGWPAITDYGDARLKSLPWITGAVLAGDVWAILDWLCRRFDAEVENIVEASSWGFSPRNIIGSTTLSNHASGTAIDLNADQHPLAAVGTFSAAQVATIRRIITDSVVDGVPVLRWGGDYSGRKDEMHFEINLMSNGNSPAKVAALAARIGIAPVPADALAAHVVTSAPAKLDVDGNLGRLTITDWQEVMGTAADGVISKPSDLVKAVQRKLNAAGARDWDGRPLTVDGVGIESNDGRRFPAGKTTAYPQSRSRTVWALQVYLGIKPDGVLDASKSATVEAVQRKLNAGGF